MSQETLFMTIVQSQCCDLFYFLIKKRVDVFYKWLSVFFATRVGAHLFTIEKSYLQFEKIKTKKESYVHLEKIKTKKKIEKKAMYRLKN